MKKVVILTVAFLGFFLSSCNKKQYTCECTTPGGAPPSDFFINDTQSNASKKCASYSTNGNPPTTCAIK